MQKPNHCDQKTESCMKCKSCKKMNSTVRLPEKNKKERNDSGSEQQ